MMLISPSIASSNLLCLQEEVEFAHRHFRQLHIDVEDGVAVPNITLGMGVCREICRRWRESRRSLHLSVLNPMAYLERVRDCQADIVFLQVGHLPNPREVLAAYREAGVPLGLAVSNRDEPGRWEPLLDEVEQALVVTNFVGDPRRAFQPAMLDIALDIARTRGMKTWIDGNVTFPIWRELRDTPLYAAVMGGGVYRDKEEALRQLELAGVNQSSSGREPL